MIIAVSVERDRTETQNSHPSDGSQGSEHLYRVGSLVL